MTTMRSLLFAWLFINAICGNAQADILDPLCPAGYQYIEGKCYSSSTCPEGHYLSTDGKCYPQTNIKCPPGYFLSTDALCYRTNPEPCPFETTTTTTEPTTTTTTTEPTTTTTTTEPTTTTTTTEPTTTTTTTTTEPTTTTTTTEPTTTTTTTTTTEPTTTTTTTTETTTTTTTEPTTTTTTTTTEPTTTTTTTTTTEPLPFPPPILDELTRCPPGFIFFDSECRKIVCSEGEFYAGRCILSACPPGTVWYGKRCQEPGYITTIIEIGNVLHNEHKYTVTSENINRVEYITAAPYDPDKDKTYDFSTPANVPDNIVAPPPTTTTTTTTTRRPWIFTSVRPTTEQPVVDEPFPGRNPGPGCCFVKSPRICINYAPNWVCSSKEKKFCDPRVCSAPVVYLKPPKIVHGENPKRVVMPPNPPLLACSTSECKESEVLDCSGCKDKQRDKCSPGCYSYYCPNGTCAFMNTEDFCAIYPGEWGCNPKDGCIWDWCSKKCY
ncbi:mucin-2 [Drosophila takahashii]|uniref:mucin-2 n=1 Tax=Drosophila takahashii TaxID=29030 RepID=UPI0038990516